MEWWQALLLIMAVLVTVNAIDAIGAKINRRIRNRLERRP